MAVAGFDNKMNPIVGLTPRMLQQFGRPRQGVKQGEQFLAHEFGHLVSGPAATNKVLMEQLVTLDPEINDPAGNEIFADNFQGAVQFLRSHNTDTTRLSAPTRKIISVLLQHDPYKDHPLNKQATTFLQMSAPKQ